MSFSQGDITFPGHLFDFQRVLSGVLHGEASGSTDAGAPDNELVKNYLQGDDEAFKILLGRYLKPVYHFVHSSIRDAQSAEDVTQDVFVKIWSHLKRFDPSKNFKVWLYTIARHTVYDFLRKKRNVPFSFLESESTVYEIEDTEPLPSDLMKRSDSNKDLESALGALPEQYREILVLYYQEGFSFREIAEILKASLNTVKSRQRRALAMLKKVMHQK